MFGDPLANITYNAVAQTLPRISTSGNKSQYRKADGSLVATISHAESGGKIRSMYRIDRNIDVNADNVLETESVYVVLERPLSGFTETDAINLATCLFTSLTASSNAGLIKLNGKES